ncbi:MAG: class I SAM-dependent methyltransferase [Thermodesulfobacteriota bacterium]
MNTESDKGVEKAASGCEPRLAWPDDSLARESLAQDALAQRKLATEARHGMRRMLKRQYELLASRLPDHGTILEVGYGVGGFLQYLAEHTLLNVVGIDVSEEHYRIARERLAAYAARIEPRLAAVEALNAEMSRDGSFTKFSAAVLRGVVHHLADPQVAFRELSLCLEHGGRLVILEGNVRSGYRRMVLRVADTIGIEHEASHFAHRSAEETAEMLRAVGFTNFNVSFVSGVFAPVAFVDLGGPAFWSVLDAVEAVARRAAPSFFGWWYLLEAEKHTENPA